MMRLRRGLARIHTPAPVFILANSAFFHQLSQLVSCVSRSSQPSCLCSRRILLILLYASSDTSSEAIYRLSIMRFPGSSSFGEDQDIAQEVLDYHIAKNGAFPRNCPRCKSHDFMVQQAEATTPVGAGPSSKVAGTAHAATSASIGSSGSGVVEWRSRPLPCETCGRWVHLGCAGVELVEQVPPRPWFHSQNCRDTFLRLEAAAERNPHPSSASPTHALYVFTPADHLAVAALAAAAGGAGGEGGGRRELPAKRGPAGAVVPLLAQGFNSDTIQGFCQPAREYDGGKYSALLLSRGKPVAAATFNVFGADAQLCLLATAVQHRFKGNGSALVADIETILGSLGVRRMLVQARSPALPLWLGSLGYEVVTPEEAEKLHRRLPLAYYDCALLDKSLSAGTSNDKEGVVH